MKKLIYIIGVFVLLVLNSCEKDFLDVNEDPNRSTAVEPNLLLMDVITGYATNYMDIGPTMQFWSNHFASGLSTGVFSNPDKFQGLDGFTNSNTWLANFDGMKSVKLARTLAEERENVNGMAQCDILSSMMFVRTSLMWEDIPYSQALDFDTYPQPDFDTQQTILKGAIAVLDQAVKSIDLSSDFKIDEIIYEGDMDKWLRFANFYKLKLYIILQTKEGSGYESEILDLIENQPLMRSNDDDFAFPYFDVEGNKNPYYRLLESYANAEPGFIYVGKVLADMMNSNNDPRREAWWVEGEEAAEGEYIGVKPGEPALTSSSQWRVESYNGKPMFFSPDAPFILSSYPEQELFIAEAYLKGYIGTVDKDKANEHYQNAVEAHMTRYGIESTTISDYLTTFADLSLYSNADALTRLYEEQYISYTNRPVDGFTQINRVGYPVPYMPAGSALDNLVKRWPIPNAEVSANPNAGEYKKDLTVKMWYQK